MTDLLIIGSGGAGLTAALTAKAKGLSVTVVTKSIPTQAQTCMAQGGINAALGNVTADSVDQHIQDTMHAAQGLADADMVEVMCHEAPNSIAWLESIGMPFSRRDNASTPLQSIAQRRLGGTQNSRACYAQDFTGLKILHTLYDRCIEADIQFITEHYLMNLIVGGVVRAQHPTDDIDRKVLGATFWDIQKGKIIAIEARNTLIATGGFGGLYHGYTTNSFGSSGDGIAAVLRAGGMVSDMEFVQFHPTALLDSSILISESARGEGGYLIDHRGERFTDELAPRDEVARAIFAQIQAGHHVRLDIRHLGKEKMQRLMPQELHLCQIHADIDPTKEPIPIMPAVHYTMGGIEVDENLQIKGLNNCYAVGECANAKVHGANRLGGNSLLEIIAFGRIVTKYIASVDQGALAPTSHIPTAEESTVSIQINHDEAVITKIFSKPNTINFYHKRKVLGKLMYRDVGIIRQAGRLHEADLYLDEIYNKIPIMGVGDKSKQNNQNLIEFLEFRNAILLAKATLKSAIHRQESRGAHYREDFPITREDFVYHSYCKLEEEKIKVVNGKQ